MTIDKDNLPAGTVLAEEAEILEDQPQAGAEQPRAAGAPDDLPQDFSSVQWQVLIGLKAPGDKPAPAARGAEHGVEYGITADAPVFVPTPKGNRPDRTIPAVHFAQFLDENMPALLSMWATQYAQYMSLVRLTAPKKPGGHLALVDTQGKRLSTDTQQ